MRKWLFSMLVISLVFIQVSAFSPGAHIYGEESQVAVQASIQEEFVSYEAGFGCKVPEEFKIVEYPQDIAVKLMGDDGSTLYIYSQDTGGFSPYEYINYSNKQIRMNRGGFRFLKENRTVLSNGVNAVELEYERDKIETIENDKNVYFEMNSIYPDSDRVLTFWLKTDGEHLENYREAMGEMAGSAWVFEKAKKEYTPPYVNREIDIKGERLRLKIGKQSMLWGIMNPHNLDGSDYTENLIPLEEKMERKFEFLMTYSDFKNHVNREEMEQVYDDSRVMMLTWQPWVFIDKTKNDNIENESAIMIPEIVGGDHDEYIRSWATDVKNIGEPVFIRFANEMNGDWDSWCSWYFGKDSELYTMAWKRIVDIFEEEGADNAEFVWNPHDRSYPNFDWNNAHMYYPGDEYVDWVGLTGYNNGTSFEGDRWREFSDIYYPVYNEYMEHYGDKPFMITEFSCSEDGGDKAKWISEGFGEFVNMPNIKIAVWFNQVDTQWDYNIDSSKRSYEAFKSSIRRNPHFSFKSVFELDENKSNAEANEAKSEDSLSARD